VSPCQRSTIVSPHSTQSQSVPPSLLRAGPPLRMVLPSVGRVRRRILFSGMLPLEGEGQKSLSGARARVFSEADAPSPQKPFRGSAEAQGPGSWRGTAARARSGAFR
jgi:hypothetical protein